MPIHIFVPFTEPAEGFGFPAAVRMVADNVLEVLRGGEQARRIVLSSGLWGVALVIDGVGTSAIFPSSSRDGLEEAVERK